MKKHLILSLIFLSITTPNLVLAQAFQCSSTSFEYFENAKMFLKARRMQDKSLVDILLQMGIDFSSLGNVIKMKGPVQGKDVSTPGHPNLMKYNISDSKFDTILLYVPSEIQGVSFDAKIKISFDGGYPMIKEMRCNLIH